MNKSKMIAVTGLATIMSASVATADGVSVNGYMEGWFTSGDNTTGVSNVVTSQSVYVSYSSTLDNGMGMTAGFTLTQSNHAAGFSIDTGMGTLATGTKWQMNSAADAMDSLPANANVQSSNNVLGSYNDGDDNSGEGIKYTSPSINGWTIAASVGENMTVGGVNDRVTSVAAKGSLMGVSIAVGAVDQVGANDDSFMTLGYSVGGVNIGYGNYDSDEDDSTAISVTTSVAGMTVGYRFDDLDAASSANDNDMSTYSIGKDMGGISLTLMYEDQDTADNSEWNLVYAIGF
ncbi:porin [Pelagibacterales bacterium]|nr:porin [Pelagibacterales bacterium]